MGADNMGRSAGICNAPKFGTRPECANEMDGENIETPVPLGLGAHGLEARIKNHTRAPGHNRRFAALCTRRSLFFTSIPSSLPHSSWSAKY